LLAEFETKYPELTIELLLTDSVVDLLTERVDIAVRLGLLEDSTLIAQRLIKINYFGLLSLSFSYLCTAQS
jgi:DNA-binding transcriptional LysR family regulator